MNNVTETNLTVLSYALITCLEPILCVAGLISNILNVIVFSNSDLEGKVFTYLLGLSVNSLLYIFLMLSRWVFRFISAETSPFVFSNYGSAFYYWYFYSIGSTNFRLFGALIEIAISLDRLLIIKKSCLNNAKLSAKSFLIVAAVLSSSASLTFISLKHIEANTNETAYFISKTKFGYMWCGKLVYKILMTYNHLILIIVMFIINGFLTLEVIKFYKRKTKIFQIQKSTSSRRGNHNQKAKFAQMTVIMFVLYFCGNIAYSIVGIDIQLNGINHLTGYLRVIAHTLVYLHIVFNTFIYYFYNKKFKAIFSNHVLIKLKGIAS